MVAKPDQEAVRKELAAEVAKKSDPLGKEVTTELGRVSKAFSEKELQGGGEVLRAVADAYQFEKKTVHFYRNGQHAWLLGYMADKSGAEKAARK